MSYVVTHYTRAVCPVQTFHKTKAEAVCFASEELKGVKPIYKGSGFKQKGSILSGRVVFEHPYFGVDCLIKIEKNN